MRVIFADTTFLLALLIRTDSLHARAISLQATIRDAEIITTEFVVTEVFRLVAKRGRTLRAAAIALHEEMQRSSTWTVVPISRPLFDTAKDVYSQHDDKHWDLVDCASFSVMHERGIREALTYDHHFEQMVFTALLRH